MDAVAEPIDYLDLARLQTHCVSQPEQDGRGEHDCGEEGFRAPVVSGGDPPPVLEAAEHDLDAVAAFVAALVVFDGLVPYFPARDAGRDALFLQGIAEPVGMFDPTV